jgi:uncharacterized protein (TIGR00266 family)
MRHLVKHEPRSSVLEVVLDPGEAITAETHAMIARSPTVRLDVQPGGATGARDGSHRAGERRSVGLLSWLTAIVLAVIRRLTGGATFLTSRVSAPHGGWVWLAPPRNGGIRHVVFRDEAMVLSAGAFVASAGEITLAVRGGGLGAALARRGPLLIEASGRGDLWVAGYGAIEEISCDGSLLVDSEHLVGFDASLEMKIRGESARHLGRAGPGEGAACELSGRGRILLQTRATGALVDWLAPLLPP